MRVAIISDLHYGVRGDAIMFLDHQKKFIDDILVPTLKERGIGSIIIPGDLVDRRKYINFNTLHRMKKDFFGPLAGCSFTILAGNHDVFHKNTNRVNALSELLGDVQGVFDVWSPTEFKYGNREVLYLPWINTENYDECMRKVKETKAKVCIAHLELAGFEMHAGHVCDHGMDAKLFDKFDLVISGHFHKKSRQGNIVYVGAPWEMTWNDYDCPRGFHILDTETLELEFIQNHYSLFQRVVYSDKDVDIKDILATVDSMHLEGVYCKVLVAEKTNPYWFDLFLSKIESKGPFDLKIVDQTSHNMQVEDVVDQAEDTLTIISKAVDRLEDVSVDRVHLKNLFSGLYKQAVSLEV